MEAAKVKSLRQLGVSVEEVRRILAGADARETLQRKAEELRAEQAGIAELYRRAGPRSAPTRSETGKQVQRVLEGPLSAPTP